MRSVWLTRRIVIPLAILPALVLGGCNSDSSEPSDPGPEDPQGPETPHEPEAPQGPDPQQVLRDLSEIVIVPNLDDFHTQAQALTTATRTLCESPDADRLAQARAAWGAARMPWKRSEAFGFGPVSDLRIDSAVDFWPIRLSSVKTELAKQTPVPEDYGSSIGDTVKGLPVLEYILFDTSDDSGGGDLSGDEIVLARLRAPDDDSTGSRTCDYALALAVDIELRAQRLFDAWSPEGDNFAAEFGEAGLDSEAYSERAKAVSAIVNAFVQLVQEVEGEKLAEPLGLRDGGTPKPQAAESWRSSTSRRDILDNLAGVWSVYATTHNGKTGASLQGAVAAADSALDDAIEAQFTAAVAAVEAIELPLDQAVVDAPEAVDAAFQACKELFRLMAVDMVNTLGVTLTFSDNDGD